MKKVITKILIQGGKLNMTKRFCFLFVQSFLFDVISQKITLQKISLHTFNRSLGNNTHKTSQRKLPHSNQGSLILKLPLSNQQVSSKKAPNLKVTKQPYFLLHEKCLNTEFFLVDKWAAFVYYLGPFVWHVIVFIQSDCQLLIETQETSFRTLFV